MDWVLVLIIVGGFAVGWWVAKVISDVPGPNVVPCSRCPHGWVTSAKNPTDPLCKKCTKEVAKYGD